MIVYLLRRTNRVWCRVKSILRGGAADIQDFLCQLFDSNGGNRDNARFRSEGFPSGQRDQTVNLTALPSKVRILLPPPVSF